MVGNATEGEQGVVEEPGHRFKMPARDASLRKGSLSRVLKEAADT